MDAINHAYEDPEFRDEPLKEGGDPTLYGDYEHIYTMNYVSEYKKTSGEKKFIWCFFKKPEAYDIVYEWREYLDNYSVQNGVPTM